jgi:hypothetical protein
MGCICGYPNKQRKIRADRDSIFLSTPRKPSAHGSASQHLPTLFDGVQKEDDFRLRFSSDAVSANHQRLQGPLVALGSETQRTQVPQNEQKMLGTKSLGSNPQDWSQPDKKTEAKAPLSSRSSVQSGTVLDNSDTLELSQSHILHQTQTKDQGRKVNPTAPISLKLLGEIDQLKKRNYFISHDLPSRIEEKENEESHFTTEHQQSDKPILESSDPKPISRVNSNSNLLAVLHRYCQSKASMQKPSEHGSALRQASAGYKQQPAKSSSRERQLKLIPDSKSSVVSVRVFRNYNRVSLLDGLAPSKAVQTAASQKKTTRPVTLKRLSKPEEEHPSPLRKNLRPVLRRPLLPHPMQLNFSEWAAQYKKKSHSSAGSPSLSNTLRSQHRSPKNLSTAITPNRNNTRRNSIISLRKMDSVDITPSSLGPSCNSTVVHHVQVLSPKKSRRDLGCKIEGLRTKIEHYILLKSIGRGNWAEDIWLVLDTLSKSTFVGKSHQAAKVLNLRKLAASVERHLLVEFVKNEIRVMQKLSASPHFPKLHEVLEDLENEKVYLVMDYCSKGAVLSSSFWKAEEAYQGMTKRENQYLPCLQNFLPLARVLKYMRLTSAAIAYSTSFSCSALRSEYHPPRYQA